MNIAANLNAENSSHGASAKLAVAALHHRDIPQSLFQEVMQHAPPWQGLQGLHFVLGLS